MSTCIVFYTMNPTCYQLHTYICIRIVVGLGEDGSLVWVEGDAEALNFEDGSVDGYTIAFGIRNVTHIEKVLSEAYR